MSAARCLGLTALAMVAFAANSVLVRLAVVHDAIDPASFTLTRLGSGAAVLWLLLVFSRRGARASIAGSWTAAAALFVYALALSFGARSLPAGTGALLLFGAVQATMILAGVCWRGERLSLAQMFGLIVALAGVVALLNPSAGAPLGGALAMIGSGVAWGVYSLLGRGARSPLAETAGNFLRATPLAVASLVLAFGGAHASPFGLFCAALSGAVASGLGYAIWYAALPGLTSVQAASAQLSVPVLTALGAALAIGEGIGLRLALSSLAVLGGVALVIARRPQKA